MAGRTLNAGQPSRSALMVARLRAAHQLLDHPPIFDDPLALPMLGAEGDAEVRANPRAFDTGFSRVVRAAMAVRSRFAEDELARAVAYGTRQYVVLGAGLDTFGCRPHEEALQVFEVDHPATQAWKRQMLGQGGVAVPDCLHFVPLDLERHTLATALAQAGCRLDEPVFFSWLGVTLYLSEQAIFDTLHFVSTLAEGSGIAFDYGVQPSQLAPLERIAVEYMGRKYAEQGEPWVSYFDPATLVRRIREMGFGEVADFGQEQLERRYCYGRHDGLHLAGGTHLMLALK